MKINKDIIEVVYKSLSTNDKENIYILKLREENQNINIENLSLKQDVENLRGKISYYENIINDSISAYRESTESLENKIFILENVILKKDNIISSIMDKLHKKYDKEKQENDREIYVVLLLIVR